MLRARGLAAAQQQKQQHPHLLQTRNARSSHSHRASALGAAVRSAPAAQRERAWAGCAGRSPRRSRLAAAPTDEAADKALEAAAEQLGLADLARQALAADPEAAAQLKRYEAAVVRLEKAKAAERELESIMRDAMTAAVEQDAAASASARSRADQLLAEAEVAAAERLLQAAELEYAGAMQEQQRLKAALGQDGERVESGKAAALAAAGGLAAALPFLFLGSSQAGLPGLLSLGAWATSCLLFGVTYRYAVRDDVANTQLRGGVVAAFALVKALGAADVIQATAESLADASVVSTAALYAGQSMLAFGFAAAALEAGFASGLVRRMPDSSNSSSSIGQR